MSLNALTTFAQVLVGLLIAYMIEVSPNQKHVDKSMKSVTADYRMGFLVVVTFPLITLSFALGTCLLYLIANKDAPAVPATFIAVGTIGSLGLMIGALILRMEVPSRSEEHKLGWTAMRWAMMIYLVIGVIVAGVVALFSIW